MRHNYSAIYQNIMLRPLEREDIESLRKWRNDSKNTKFLRKIEKITPEMQKQWYENYLSDADEICFAIVETQNLDRMVGSVSIYNFGNRVAEVGKILIGDVEAHGMGIGRKALVMAMWVGFERLGLEKIVGSVHQNNIAAHKNDMKIGFNIVGKHLAPMGGFEDELEIDKKRLSEINKYTSDILIRDK